MNHKDARGDWSDVSTGIITKIISGKTLTRVEKKEDHGDDWLALVFSDGTELLIRYDYLYEWEIKA